LGTFRPELRSEQLVEKCILRKTNSHYVTAANTQDANVSVGIKFRTPVTVGIKTIQDVMLAEQRMAPLLIATLPIEVEPLHLSQSCKTSSRKFSHGEKRLEVVHSQFLEAMACGLECHTRLIITASTQFVPGCGSGT
jgi:hypothetical protein